MPNKLEPIVPEYNFIRRVMRRFNLNHVIVGDQVVENGEYGLDMRDATNPELTMWDQLIPHDVRDKLHKIYSLDKDLVFDPTYEEIEQILDCYGTSTWGSRTPYVYLSPDDYIIFRDGGAIAKEKPEINTDNDKISLGWYASYKGSYVCVSEWIPRGYYYLSEKLDELLNKKPTSSNEEIGSTPNNFDYCIKPIERLF